MLTYSWSKEAKQRGQWGRRTVVTAWSHHSQFDSFLVKFHHDSTRFRDRDNCTAEMWLNRAVMTRWTRKLGEIRRPLKLRRKSRPRRCHRRRNPNCAKVTKWARKYVSFCAATSFHSVAVVTSGDTTSTGWQEERKTGKSQTITAWYPPSWQTGDWSTVRAAPGSSSWNLGRAANGWGKLLGGWLGGNQRQEEENAKSAAATAPGPIADQWDCGTAFWRHLSVSPTSLLSFMLVLL